MIDNSTHRLALPFMDALLSQGSNFASHPTVQIKRVQQVDLISVHLPAAKECDVRQRKIKAGLFNGPKETQVFNPAY